MKDLEADPAEEDVLADSEGVRLALYGARELCREASDRFPELREDLAEEADLLHLQIATLARAVEADLEHGGQRALAVCELLGDVLARADVDPEIENALAISFVDAGELQKSRSGNRLLAEMPRRVREALLSLSGRQRCDDSMSNPKGRS